MKLILICLVICRCLVKISDEDVRRNGVIPGFYIGANDCNLYLCRRLLC